MAAHESHKSMLPPCARQGEPSAAAGPHPVGWGLRRATTSHLIRPGVAPDRVAVRVLDADT